MIVCHVCGTNNPDGAKFCEGCGVELQANANTAAAAPAPAPAAPAGPLPTVAETIPGDLPVSAVVPAVEAASAPAADASSAPAPVVEAAAPVVAAEAPAAPAPEAAASAPATSAPETSAEPVSAPASSPAPETPAAAPIPVPVPAAAPAASGAPVNPRLVPRQFGALGSTSFPLNGSRLSVGRFDPSTGPVDIDLSGLPGDSHVSRRHGELFFENNRWMVRDLGSTNGIYIKRASDSQFGPRLQAPAELQNGDEIAFGNVMFVYQEDATA